MIPTYYCQRDYWDQLGQCPGITIHDYGCYVTSAAMIATKFQHPIDPPGLNRAWYGQYVNGCDATDHLLPNTYPDITLQGSPWGREHLFGLDPNTQSAIIQIDGTQTLGYITHYLAFDKTENGRVLAVDPWYGDLCDVEARYGNVIQKVAIYGGPSAVPTPVLPTGPGSAGGNMVGLAFRPGGAKGTPSQPQGNRWDTAWLYPLADGSVSAMHSWLEDGMDPARMPLQELGGRMTAEYGIGCSWDPTGTVLKFIVVGDGGGLFGLDLTWPDMRVGSWYAMGNEHGQFVPAHLPR